MSRTITTRKPQQAPTLTKGATFVKKNRGQYDENDWVVFTYNEDRTKAKPRVYSGSRGMSRTAVRSAYNNETKLRSFDDTRARRVSNFR